MTPGARIQAAIEIIEDLEAHPRPADRVLREWGTAHRFAGSKDRAAIRSHVFAAFRRRGEAIEAMGASDARSIMLGSTRIALGWSPVEIAASLRGGAYEAPGVTPTERALLEAAVVRKIIPGALNWPSWLADKMTAQHAEHAEDLMAALLGVAPLDLRVNAALGSREAALEALRSVGFPAEPTPYSPWGIRVARDADLVGTNIRALPMFRDGRIEIQDEGSQLAALLSQARPGEQILELCAGGAGKTLALAAMTGRAGQIFACDVDAARLKTGHERVRRANLHNVQPRHIAEWDPNSGEPDPDLEELAGKMDLVFLDVPCTGSGAWRRAPDAKWWLKTDELVALTRTQSAILQRGARLVKPGGRLVYVTCSVFAEENAEQIIAFLDRANWQLADAAAIWRAAIGGAPPDGTIVEIPGAGAGNMFQLSPLATHTDGFFIAILKRAAPNDG